MDVFSIIHSHIKDLKIPICFNFPVSHETENVALKVGVKHELKVGKEGVSLKEVF
jgi:muramoyltetrapeptide carboxypeptidase